MLLKISYILSEILSKGGNYISVILLAKNLTVSEVGKIGLINSVVYFLFPIILQNQQSYYSYSHSTENNSELNKKINLNAFIILTSTALIIIVFMFIANWFDLWYRVVVFEFNELIIMLTISLTIALQSYIINVARFNNLHKQYFIYVITYLVLDILIIIFLLYIVNLNNYRIKIYELLMVNIITTLLSIYLVKDFINIDTKIFKSESLKHQIKYGIILIPNNLSIWLKSGLDRVLLSAYVSYDSSGLFTFISSLSVFISVISTGYFNYFSPVVIKSFKKQHVKYESKIISEFLIFLFSLSLIGIVMVILFVKYIHLINSEYKKGTNLLIMLIINSIIQSIYVFLSAKQFYLKKNGYISFVTTITSTTHALLMISLSNILKVEYIAYSLIFTNIISIILIRINLYEKSK